MTKTLFNPPIGSPPAVQFIGVHDLWIDDSYQRSADAPQSRNLIARMAKDWDWRLCMPLMVSEREGKLWVIDGQHRLQAALKREDIAHLPCCVIKFNSAREESDMFVQANKARKALTTIDLFRAAVAAGREAESETFALISAAGLKVANHTNTASLAPGALTIVNGVTRAISRYGKSVVGAALDAMGEAFKDQPIPRAATLFGALLRIFAERERHPIDPDVLADVLKESTAQEWVEYPELDGASGSVRIDILTRLIRELVADAVADID